MHKDGPLLIIAGPGSGKTRTIACSIAYAIENLEVDPSKIAAFTFTNKAKDELKNKVGDFVAERDIVNDIWISTFHSFCGHVWNNRPEKIIKENERDFTAEELARIYRKRMRYQIDCLQHHKFVDDKEILNTIKQWEKQDISPAGISNQEVPQICVDVYKKYKQILEGSSDIFTKIQIFTNALLRDAPEVRTKWQEKFELIFVDEFQDTDPIQYEIIKALAGEHPNLRVVGDDDQSIYGWRGADIQNILNFENDYSINNPITLGQNYRSTQMIVEASRALAEFNPDRREKELFTRNCESGEKVIHLHCESSEEEAAIIATFIHQAINQGSRSPSDFAVLYRTKEQAHAFKKPFKDLGIQPHIVKSSLDTPENVVSLMTIHQSKGLEFPNVFVAGVCSGLLPLYNSKKEDWGEELRLLYVAMTRAKNWLCLSFYEKDANFQRGRSPFLKYIPTSLLKFVETLENIPIPSCPKKIETVVIKEPSNYEPLPKKLLGSGMTVIGVDPGNIGAEKTTNVGWSVTRKVSDGYSVLDHNTEHPTGNKKDRLEKIKHTINRLVELHLPDAIAVEKLEVATRKAKEDWFRYVAGCVAAIRAIADQHGIECRLYTPQQVKYSATGNKNAIKPQVEQGVKERCTLKKALKTDHEADAIAVSLCYLRSHLNSARFEGNKRKEKCYETGCDYLNRGQYDAAISKFQEAVNIDPIYTNARCGLGRAYLVQGDLEKAENAAKKALRFTKNNHPDSQKLLDAIKHYRSGCSAVDNKQFNEAITEFQESIALEPLFINARYELSRAHLRLSNNVEKVKNTVEEALKLANDHSPIHLLSEAIRLYNEGRDSLNVRQYNDAINKLKEAIDRESNFTEAHYWLGYAHLKNKVIEAAEQSANDTLELNINHRLAGVLLDDIKKAYVDKGYNALERLDLTEAEKYTNKAFHIDRNCQLAHKLSDSIKQAYYNRALNHLDNLQYDAAIAAFEETINRYPKFTEAHCGLGQVYLEKGNLTAAEIFANKARRLDSNYQPSLELWKTITQRHCELARNYLNQDNLTAAENSAREALRLETNCERALQILKDVKQKYCKDGMRHLEQGDLTAAKRSTNEALRIAPDYQPALELLGDIRQTYYKRGLNFLNNLQYDAAVTAFKETINRYPKFTEAHCGLGQVYLEKGNLTAAENSAREALRFETNYERALQILKGVKQKYCKNGMRHLEKGNLTAAERSANEARRFDRDYPPMRSLLKDIKQAYYNRSCDHLDNQRYDEAIDAFKETISKYPKFTEAHYKLAQAYLEEGDDLAVAEELIKETLSEVPPFI